MLEIIQRLPEHLAHQIAAGEIVQRPASVVKELLENAIDAGATEIQLFIEDGGKTLIQVVDNGKGMSFKDAKNCFERYATSKIRKAEDLFQIQTKGFRGEALAAIAAVAQIDLKTAQNPEELGTNVVIHGGTLYKHEPCACSLGVSMKVQNLFFNTPARRAFLKNDVVENRNILLEFERVILTHPEISFQYYNNQQLLYTLPATSLKQRIIRFFGKNYEERICVLDTEQLEDITLKGFISKPEYAKKHRGEQYFFVNRRFFKHAYFHQAVMEAMGPLLKPNTFPTYLLYLEVDPKKIDVNVHPAKIEIQFQQENLIYNLLISAIRKFLGKYNFLDTIHFDLQPEDHLPYLKTTNNIQIPDLDLDLDYNPFLEDISEMNPFFLNSKSYETHENFSESVDFSNMLKKENDLTENLDSYRQKSFFLPKKTENSENLEGNIQENIIKDLEKNLVYHAKKTTEIREWTENTENSQNSTFYLNDQSHLPSKEGSYFLMDWRYLILPEERTLWFVDLLRAYYRVEFDKLVVAWAQKKMLIQSLLFPTELHLTPQEFLVFEWMKNELEDLGFEFLILDQQQVQIFKIPSVLAKVDLSACMTHLLSEQFFHPTLQKIKKNQWIAKLITKYWVYQLPKKIKQLQDHDLKILRKEWLESEEPCFCPEGKPIFFSMNSADIKKKLS